MQLLRTNVARSVLYLPAGKLCKKAELTEMPSGRAGSCGAKESCISF